MDSLTIELFLERDSSNCLRQFDYWHTFGRPEWQETLLRAVSWFQECWPEANHYWKDKPEKLVQFALDTQKYLDSRNYFRVETLTTRSQLLNIADKIQLFGDSVIRVIEESTAGTNHIQNLTQEQINEFDSSLLSVEDASRVQSFSNHMDALRETISESLDHVSIFQNKISELKHLLANSVRPTVEGALAFSYPHHTEGINFTRAKIEEETTLGADAAVHLAYEKSLLDIRRNLAAKGLEESDPGSPLIFSNLLSTFIELSESLSRVQPALSNFEQLWIETCSFIRNSKENADTIQNGKMLRVFKTRMQKIVNEWISVKNMLGDQPVAIQ